MYVPLLTKSRGLEGLKRKIIDSGFSSKLADISVGSVGSPDGYSTVIIRSEKRRELFDLLEADTTSANRDEIAKLASIKAKRGNEND